MTALLPFALTLAGPSADDGHPAFTYDAGQQLNLLPDGRPAISIPDPWCWTASKSTAGSKVHRDDTDDAG